MSNPSVAANGRATSVDTIDRELDPSTQYAYSSGSEESFTKPCVSFFESDIVTLTIGHDGHVFHAHKQLLRYKAPMLVAQSREEIQVSSSSISLKYVDVDGFRVFMRWLYNEPLPTCSNDFQGGALHWDAMKHAYCIADRFGIVELQNKLIDIHLEGLSYKGEKYFWDVEQLEDLQASGLVKTPFFDLTLRSTVRAIMEKIEDPENAISMVDDISSRELMKEVMKYMVRYLHTPWEDVSEMDRCAFHTHEDGERCPAQ